MQITTPLTDVLSRYLDLTSLQFKLTASNAANIDTPHYQTLGIDFASEFASASADALNMRQSEEAGTKPDELAHTPKIFAVDGLLERPDGNNVSMDREGLQMGEEQLKYKTGIELLKEQFTEVSDAIQEK
ncbi:MAG TPA: flagellar basal body rod protein FlgB [Acidobacteriaceae bacterium]|jgi:flagellar basal-body rod protein FlgB|nr:flagellar basal body rod protein FlgB [Acidobacteriaceae bacterium]